MEKAGSNITNPEFWEAEVFNISNTQQFNETALRIFYLQAARNPVYREYLQLRGIKPESISALSEIPFLPIEVFKTHRVLTTDRIAVLIFRSSGTTAAQRSVHEIIDPEIYNQSALRGFELFFGKPEDWIILALLPSYLERNDASLVYYTDLLIRKTADPESGFYLDKLPELASKLKRICSGNKKVLLLGVSFALLDLIEMDTFYLPSLHIMETGGMKGRRKELTRPELHDLLVKGFGTSKVYSEYGMTELLSQAYCTDGIRFHCPPWMKVLIREADDPYNYCKTGVSGGINVIDLCNIYSCSFISTQDLGKLHDDGSFEVIGRFDNSDLRGCNLMLL